MNCINCCKAFCKNRIMDSDSEFGCDHGVSFLQANILDTPKKVEKELFDFNYGVTLDQACKAVAGFKTALVKLYNTDVYK